MVEPLRVRFHHSIYEPLAVRRAADRFVQLAEIEVEAHEHDTVVTLRPARESVRARIGDELGNHALFETLVLRRSA